MEFWDLGEGAARNVRSVKGAGHVAYHPSLPQVALAYTDGSIGLFELPGGREINTLRPDLHSRQVRLALHPTEPVVAVSSYSRSPAQVRDLRTGKVLAALPLNGNAGGVAWSPDGRTLAVGLTEGQQVRLYDRATYRLMRTLETTSFVTHVGFNPAGDRLAAFDWSGGREFFDVGTGRRLEDPPTP